MTAMFSLAASSRRFRVLAWSCAVATALLGTAPAGAQDEDPVKQARMMFHQGLELEQAGNWAGALRMFREVSQVKITPQVRFHIALCEENLGKLVAALGGYELALAEADSVGESFRVEVEEKIAALRVRIPKLVIERGDGAEAAKVELDGVLLGSSSIGVDVPIDPGPHVVTATAPGFDDFSTTIDVAEESTQTVTVTLAETEVAPVEEEPDVEEPEPPPEKKFPVVPVSLIGGGGVLLLGSGAMLIMRSVALNDFRSLCPGDLCPPKSQLTDDEQDEIEKSRSRVMTYGVLSPVLAVAGAGAAGVGVVMLIRQSKADRDEADTESARVRVTPELGPERLGLTVQGRF